MATSLRAQVQQQLQPSGDYGGPAVRRHSVVLALDLGVSDYAGTSRLEYLRPYRPFRGFCDFEEVLRLFFLDPKP